MGSKNKKANWILPNGNNSNFSKSTNNAQKTKTFASKPKPKKKVRWNVSRNQVSAYSKSVNTKDIVKSKIIDIEDRTFVITDSPWYTIVPLFIFTVVAGVLIWLLSTGTLTIQNFGSRTELSQTETIFFLLLKTTTLISLILAFTRFKNSNTKFIALVWLSFIASLFSSWIGSKDFYSIVSIAFIVLMPILYAINKVRENPPVKERLNFITIAIAFLSIVLITIGTIVGAYWMSWIEPGNDANVNNEYLIALTISFFLVGITTTTFKRPSGLFLVWFGALFATIAAGMEGFYLGLTAGIILLPIIIFMFIDWQDINFTKKVNNSKITQFNLSLPA